MPKLHKNKHINKQVISKPTVLANIEKINNEQTLSPNI